MVMKTVSLGQYSVHNVIISGTDGAQLATHSKPNVVLRVASVIMLCKDMAQLSTSEIIPRAVAVTNYSTKHFII